MNWYENVYKLHLYVHFRSFHIYSSSSRWLLLAALILNENGFLCSKVKVLVLRLISDIHPTLHGLTFPSSACSLLSPSHLPGEDTALVEPKLIVLTNYWAITASLLGANLSTTHKLEGWKVLVDLEVACPGIEPRSLAQELQTLTTKPCHLQSKVS